MFPLSLLFEAFNFLKIPNIRKAALIGGTGLLIIGGVWLVCSTIQQKLTTQASAIEMASQNLQEAEGVNKTLSLSLTQTKEERDDAERRLIELNNKHLQEAKELEVFKRENAELQYKLTEAMADDPCSAQPLPGAAIRLHSESIKSFNTKYSAEGKTQQANTASGNVPIARGTDHKVR
jgi:chromosome segregation ATPase